MANRWCGVLIVASASTLAGCGAKHDSGDAKKSLEIQPVTVTVAVVEKRPVVRTVEVVGSLKGWEDVTVGNKRTGRVLKIYHDMGDRVRPGDPLVELDPVDIDLSVAQAERSLTAQLEQVGLQDIPKAKFDESSVPAVVQARFALEKAQQNLARERALRQRGAGTQQDYQNAELDERAADAALKNAQLNARAILANAMVNKVMLDVVRQQRSDLIIRAPFPSRPLEGTKAPASYAVAKRSVSEGQMLKEGDALLQLVIVNPLRLWASVPERYSDEVKVGQDVRLSVASFPDKEFLGKVTRINPSVDSTSRTFQVEAVVPNDDNKLRPGGFAKASIVTNRADDAVTVPLESVVKSKGITKLFIVGDDHKAKSIPIETGLQGSGWIEVIGAVPPGAKVITTGQVQLADGIPTVIRDPEAAGKTESAAKSEPVKPAG
jgi:membrane fusion protein (multidrug efflux system)